MAISINPEFRNSAKRKRQQELYGPQPGVAAPPVAPMTPGGGPQPQRSPLGSQITFPGGRTVDYSGGQRTPVPRQSESRGSLPAQLPSSVRQGMAPPGAQIPAPPAPIPELEEARAAMRPPALGAPGATPITPGPGSIPTPQQALGRAQGLGLPGAQIGVQPPPGFDMESPLAEYGSFRFSDEDPSQALSYSRMRSPEEEMAFQQRMTQREYLDAGLEPPEIGGGRSGGRDYLDPNVHANIQALQSRLDRAQRLYDDTGDETYLDEVNTVQAELDRYMGANTGLPQISRGGGDETGGAGRPDGFAPDAGDPAVARQREARESGYSNFYGSQGPGEAGPSQIPPDVDAMLESQRPPGGKKAVNDETGEYGWVVNGEFVPMNGSRPTEPQGASQPQPSPSRPAEPRRNQSSPPSSPGGASVAESFIPSVIGAGREAIGKVGSYLGERTAENRMNLQRADRLYQQELAKFNAGQRSTRPTREEISRLLQRL